MLLSIAMKGPVALLLCTVITAVAFSAPLPSEKKAAKWLHSIRDEFLSPRGKANRLGFLSSLPRSSYISHLNNPFLSRQKSTSQPIEGSIDILLEMIQDFSNMDRVNKMSISVSSLNEASAKVLEEIFNSKQSSSVSSLPTSRSTLKQMEELVEVASNSLQNDMEIDQLTHDFAEKCVKPFTHQITNIIKLRNNFGIRNPHLEKLLKFSRNFLRVYILRLTSNNYDDDYNMGESFN